MAPMSSTRGSKRVAPPVARAGTVMTTAAMRLATARPSRPGQRRPVPALSRMYAAHAPPASRAYATPAGSRPAGSKPSRTTPAAARSTQSTSPARRKPSTANVRGPMNSMVTAMPSGMRAKDW